MTHTSRGVARPSSALRRWLGDAWLPFVGLFRSWREVWRALHKKPPSLRFACRPTVEVMEERAAPTDLFNALQTPLAVTGLPLVEDTLSPPPAVMGKRLTNGGIAVAPPAPTPSPGPLDVSTAGTSSSAGVNP